MFGRKKRNGESGDAAAPYDDEYTEYDEYDDEEDEYEEEAAEYEAAVAYDESDEDTGEFPVVAGERTGPYNYEDVVDQIESIGEQRLDLGSVIVPVPPGGQLQVEMTPEGAPQAVHLATEHGRITVAAYAAPKSPGQWRSVAADLAETLRKDGAQVSVQNGPWGRELHAVTEGADLRFIGVDGYRWMVRLVAAGPSGAATDGTPLVAAARAILGETVVRRGDEPLPVREPLPVVLPQELADQLAAAHQQQLDAQQQAVAAQLAAMQGGPQPIQAPNGEPRRGAEGSAMQQLGLN
ncbi:DUF3710 domain-containing protein [Nocardia sp. NBC_01327]|uniref:DUF3710 domain-containing protein n=1 Tax=Nocardia sp. NBC_01327 TaxID=2903593 RepID=UPI003FA39213